MQMALIISEASISHISVFKDCHFKWQVAFSTPADVGADTMLVLHGSENKKT